MLKQLAVRLAHRALHEEPFIHTPIVKDLFSKMQDVFGSDRLVDFLPSDPELWSCVASHGDLWAGNILLSRQDWGLRAHITLIDWEPGQPAMLPWWFDFASIAVIPAFWPPGRENKRFLIELLEDEVHSDSFGLGLLSNRSQRERVSFVALFLLTQLVHKKIGGRLDYSLDKPLLEEAEIIIRRFMVEFHIAPFQK